MIRTIVITGATSGVGRELALHYAAPHVVLGLVGRDGGRLEQVAAEVERRGAQAILGTIDVRDRVGLAGWLEAVDRDHPIDLLIANAGVMEGTPPGGPIEPADAAYDLMQINVLGVMNTVQPALQCMMARGQGQIAIMSSIAAFVPLADSPSYCASKSAVLSYGLSLRALLADHGIRVNVICPGYIDTPMMQRENGAKPFKMSAEKAAGIIAIGLKSNKGVIDFPALFSWVTWLNGILPDSVRRWLTGHFRFTVLSAPNKPD